MYTKHFDGNVKAWVEFDERGVRNQVATNVPREVVEHSPTGFEIGYAGSGPADFALNIMHQFLPLPKGAEGVALHEGVCSQVAYRLHQPFKFEFIATMSRDGGEISRADIVNWLIGQGVEKERIRKEFL